MIQKLQKAIPEPVTELRHRNPFELLISVILSAQATDKSVNLVTPTLFETISDPTGSGKRGGESGIGNHQNHWIGKDESSEHRQNQSHPGGAT